MNQLISNNNFLNEEDAFEKFLRETDDSYPITGSTSNPRDAKIIKSQIFKFDEE